MKFWRRKHHRDLDYRWTELSAQAEAIGYRLLVTLAAKDALDIIDLTRDATIVGQIDAIEMTLTDPAFVAFRNAKSEARIAEANYRVWAGIARQALDRATAASDKEESARNTLRAVAAERVEGVA